MLKNRFVRKATRFQLSRRTVFTLLTLLVSFGFLLAFAWGADWPTIWEEVKNANPIWLVAASMVQLSTFYIRSFRWRILLRPVADIPLMRLTIFTTLGFGGNIFLPARAGEVVRVALAAKERNLPFSSVLATLVLERILDLMALLSMLLIVLTYSSNHADPDAANLGKVGMVFAAATGAIILGLLIFTFFPKPLLSLTKKLTQPLPESWQASLLGLLETFATGLGSLKSPGALLGVCFYTIIIWGLLVVHFLLIAKALGMALGAWGATATLVASGFASALPQAPGFIGTFHVACEAALRMSGIPVSAAKGYAVVSWCVGSIPLATLALVLASKEGLNFSSLKQMKPESNSLS